MKVFKHTKLLAAILLASQSYQAHSIVFTLDITTESSAIIVNGATDGPNIDTSPTNASSSAFVSTSDNNNSDVEVRFLDSGSYFNANAYTYASGDSDGAFYLTSGTYGYGSVNETFGSLSTLTQSYEVTNDSALEQLFDFTFEVENGSISANCGGYGEDFFFDLEVGYGSDGSGSNECLTGDSAAAAYDAEIFLNDVSIWNSSASIVQDVVGTDLDLTNDLLGGTSYGSSYYWNAQSFTLDLGTFAAGETFSFDYVVSVASAGTLVNDSDVDAYAQFGDPNGFGASNNGPFGNPVSVPEPASLALMMTGLLGFGVAAKRRKKSK